MLLVLFDERLSRVHRQKHQRRRQSARNHEPSHAPHHAFVQDGACVGKVTGHIEGIAIHRVPKQPTAFLAVIEGEHERRSGRHEPAKSSKAKHQLCNQQHLRPAFGSVASTCSFGEEDKKRIRSISVLHNLSYPPEAFVQERNTGCRPPGAWPALLPSS